MKRAVLTVALLLLPLPLAAATLHLKTGVEIDGRKVGRDGNSVYVETETSTLRFPAGEVDLGKTFPPGSKEGRKMPGIPGTSKSTREKVTAVKPAPDKPSRPESVKHQDSTEGFEVTYPGSWVKTPVPGKLLQIHDYKSKASFSITKTRTTLTAASLTTYLKGTGSLDFLKDVRKQLPDSYLVETREITLGGEKAILITYAYRPTASDARYNMAATRIICIRQAHLYILFHETPMTLYRANHAALERIIASFTFR